MTDLLPHRRQFLLSKIPVNNMPDDFRVLLIKDNWNLYVHSDLKMSDLAVDNDPAIILGEWVDINYKNVFGYVFKDKIAELTYFFSGKWCIISDNEIYSDPTGLFGIYYTKLNRRGNDKLVISSSPTLIANFFHEYDKDIDPRELMWGKSDGMEWFPPPATKYSRISKLLPTQVLKLNSGEIRPVKRINYNSLKGFSYCEKIELAGEYLKKVALEISNKWGNIKIALTSGNDSRLILAAFLSQDLHVGTFTFRYPGIRSGDISVPKDISRRFGLIHNVVKGKRPFDSEKVRILNEHNGGIVNDGEEFFVGSGHFSQLNLSKDTVMIRTGISDLFRLLYRNKLPEFSNNTQLITKKIISAYGFKNVTDNSFDGISDWLNWYANNSTLYPVDWRDLFYLEQRICGWMSGNELTMDIFDFSTFQPMNSQFLIDLALSFTDDERNAKDYKHGKIQPDIIKYLYPDLLKFPINPPDYFNKLKNKSLKILKNFFQK